MEVEENLGLMQDGVHLKLSVDNQLCDLGGCHLFLIFLAKGVVLHVEMLM